jgi:hypothetical protein
MAFHDSLYENPYRQCKSLKHCVFDIEMPTIHENHLTQSRQDAKKIEDSIGLISGAFVAIFRTPKLTICGSQIRTKEGKM